MRLLKPLHRKLRNRYAQLCEGIEWNLAVLGGLEKSKCQSLDQAAESFAKIMEVIFREGSLLLYEDEEQDNLHETFAKIGYHMASGVSLDAADDIEDNIETGALQSPAVQIDWRERLAVIRFAEETPSSSDSVSGLPGIQSVSLLAVLETKCLPLILRRITV